MYMQHNFKREISPDNTFNCSCCSLRLGLSLFLSYWIKIDEPQLAVLCLETLDKNTPKALTAKGFILYRHRHCHSFSAAVLDRDSLRIYNDYSSPQV